MQKKCVDYRFHCVGQISLPPGGDTFVVLPGQNVTLAWKIDINISDISYRSWTFIPKGMRNIFAGIVLDLDVFEYAQNSPGPFIIKKPSSLILKNVNIQYNGTYRFRIYVHGVYHSSNVHVFVAGKYLFFTFLTYFSSKDLAKFLIALIFRH